MSTRDQDYYEQAAAKEAQLHNRPHPQVQHSHIPPQGPWSTNEVGGSQCQEALSPLQRMSRSFDQLDNAIDEFESLVQTLCDGPEPCGTSQAPARELHSVQSAVRNSPDMLDTATKRIHSARARLSDALLAP